MSRDAERSGSGLLNLAVADIAGEAERLAGLGLEPGAIQDVNKGVQLCPLTDPAGNAVTLIGSFREDY